MTPPDTAPAHALSRWKTPGCVFLLLVLTVAFFYPVVFSAETFIARDNYIFFNPRRFFAAEALQQGRLPLWNPYIACGVPFQANLQSALFYPFSLLYYLLPFQQGFKYFIVLHYVLGALGMFALMRAWSSSRSSALLAALTFSLGGYMLSINDNVAFLCAAAWLPLALLCHHRALASGSVYYSLIAGMVMALQIYAGDASFYLLSTGLCMFLYTLCWPFMRPVPSPARLKPWLQLGLAGVVGMGLAAVQLIPFAEFALHSTRAQGISFALATKWSYHPLELLQLLVPYLFGCSVPETRWLGQYWLDTFYIGIFPLMLSVLYLRSGPDRRKGFLLGLVAVSIFFSLGKYNPLFVYLHRFLPGADMLLFPVKFLFLGAFGLAVMAGNGLACLQRLVCRHDAARRILSIPAAGMILMTAFLAGAAVWREELYHSFSLVYPTTAYMSSFKGEMFASLFTGLAASSALTALFVMVVAGALKWKKSGMLLAVIIIAVTWADLRYVGKPQDPTVNEALIGRTNSTVDFLKQDSGLYRIYALSPLVTQKSFMHLARTPFEKVYQALSEVLPANLNMYHHIFSVQEYSALLNKHFYDLMGPVEACFTHEGTAPDDRAWCRSMLNLFNVKYILSPRPLIRLGFSLVKDGPIKIYANRTALPRAFFVDRLTVVDTEQAVLSRMAQPDFDPAVRACITRSESLKLLDGLQHLEEGLPGARAVTVDDYTPNRIVLHARTAQPGFLVLSDTYYPGWRAFVGEDEVPVVKVNHVLRGIPVPRGNHAIRFVFRPRTFTLGALISLGWLLGSVFSVVALRARRTKTRKEKG